MTTLTKLDAVEQLELLNLAAGFFQAIDHRDYDGIIDDMTPDGTWHRQGKLLRGHADVREALDARPGALVVRHAMTSPVVRSLDDDRAAVDCLLVLFAGELEVGDTLPLRSAPPYNTADYRFVMRRVGGGWKIESMTSDSVFRA